MENLLEIFPNENKSHSQKTVPNAFKIKLPSLSPKLLIVTHLLVTHLPYICINIYSHTTQVI